MANAYDYVVHNGLQSTGTYPYTSMVRMAPAAKRDGSSSPPHLLCLYFPQDTQPCFYDSKLAVAHIKDYRFIPKGDEQALADAVATIGPITVAIDASHSSFLFYSSGRLKGN